MKKYLIPRRGKFYKANMHTHTTFSDGKITPEEIKKAYMAAGYSIVAYTDHEIMIPHAELQDENFLPITAIEIAIDDGKWSPFTKTYHLNIYSPSIGRCATKAYFHGEVWGNARNYMTDDMILPGQRSRNYSKEFVQWIIDSASEEGCLVCYNHPVWSLQTREDYSGLKGLWGVEWFNTGATVSPNGQYVDSPEPIVELLREGERMIYPIAADDCHSTRDFFGGWIQVKATSLDYNTVFKALKKGNFYSSTGPSIKSLYLDGTYLTVKTSAAKCISVISSHRWARRQMANEKMLYGTTFNLESLFENAKNAPEGHNVWFRLEVIDKAGNKALTRAYFLDELKVKKIK